MGWWDRVKQALGAGRPAESTPRARRASGRTWRLTWRDEMLALVAPHGTFQVKAIAEPVLRALHDVPDGTDFICEGDLDGGSTITELVVTSATLAPPLVPNAKSATAAPAKPPGPHVAVERLLGALNALEPVRWCEGQIARVPLSVETGGESGSLDDVAWLSARAERAPYGERNETKLDETVRSTLRLRGRGGATIRGLDLAAIVAKVEEAFATETHLEAVLHDVLLYPSGGKFLRHKDTPRAPRELGTLLIEVPLAHRGGELVLSDGDVAHRIGWGDPASAIRWVALFGDVDHEVEPVTEGTRVAIAYTLVTGDRPRSDPTLAAHLDTIADAAIALLADPSAKPRTGQFIVPCERLAVAIDDRTEPLTAAMLRGNDRAIARTFERCGFDVAVTELLLPPFEHGDPFAVEAAYPLRGPIPNGLLAGDAVSLTDDIDDEEYGPMEVTSLQSYLEECIPRGDWLVRRAAGARLVYSGLVSETGYFGNEAGDGHLYVAAALVLRPPA
jgi:hypothetical protein